MISPLCGIDVPALFAGYWVLKAVSEAGVVALNGVGEEIGVQVAKHSARSVVEYFREHGRRPLNHDLARGFRSAALDALTSPPTEEEVHRSSYYRETAEILAVAERVSAWAWKELADIERKEFDDESTTRILEVIQTALSDPSLPLAYCARRLQREVEDAMIADICKGLSVKHLPPGFVALFRGEEPHRIGWFGLANTKVVKALKADDKFKRIVDLTTQAAIHKAVTDISGRTIDILDAVHRLDAKFERLAQREGRVAPDAIASSADVARWAQTRASDAARTFTDAELRACVAFATTHGVARLQLREMMEGCVVDKARAEAGVADWLAGNTHLRRLAPEFERAIAAGDVRAAVQALREAEEFYFGQNLEAKRSVNETAREVARVRELQGDFLCASFEFRAAAERYAGAAEMLNDIAEDAAFRQRYLCASASALLEEGRTSVLPLREAVILLATNVIPNLNGSASECCAALSLYGVALTRLCTRLDVDAGAPLLAAAEATLRRAVEIAPNDVMRADAHHNLGCVLKVRGSAARGRDRRRLLEEAVGVLRSAVSARTRLGMAPERARSNAELGGALVELGVPRIPHRRLLATSMSSERRDEED